MKLQLFVATSCLFLASLATSALAGDFTTDREQWRADACGELIEIQYDLLTDNEGNSLDQFNGFIPNEQPLPWGNLSQSGTASNGDEITGVAFNGTTAFGVFAVAFPEGPIRYTIDPADSTLGPLSGFSFRYGNPSRLNVFVYDAEGNVVDSFLTPGVGQDVSTFDDEDTETHLCWTNTTGVNVTHFEVVPVDELVVIFDGTFSFGECDETELTCFEQLADVKSAVDQLMLEASFHDAYWLSGASDCINWMQHDCFWVQPSGNRLSRYGGSMFIGAAYAVSYLERVDDPMADVLIDELLDVLECIVDHEIAYAIENGGNQCYINNAEAFAELGTIIDEDFDNQVIATLAYRLAWLHAYYSTY